MRKLEAFSSHVQSNLPEERGFLIKNKFLIKAISHPFTSLGVCKTSIKYQNHIQERVFSISTQESTSICVLEKGESGLSIRKLAGELQGDVALLKKWLLISCGWA